MQQDEWKNDVCDDDDDEKQQKRGSTRCLWQTCRLFWRTKDFFSIIKNQKRCTYLYPYVLESAVVCNVHYVLH